MSQTYKKPLILKLSLSLILIASAVIFGCESVPLITQHESLSAQKLHPQPEVDSITQPKEATASVKDVAPIIKPQAEITSDEVFSFCTEEIKKLPGTKPKESDVAEICKKMELFPKCHSTKGLPIFHFDKISNNPEKAKKILTISLIHGDEPASGTVARSWINRLDSLSPRNSWRVIPIANPDGFRKLTRMNINGVDLNRNFPTADWEDSAIKHWKEKKKADPRKFPGDQPASEIETQCLIKHIEDFDPDFIISVHTPYGVLDFDGPPMNFPAFKPLPWISLGNYPGSLGRYMWVNNNIPVLTIELKGNNGVHQLENFDKLQDISGTVAIQATKIIQSGSQKKDKELKKN